MLTARNVLAAVLCWALAAPVSAQDREWSREGALRSYERAKDRDDGRRGWIVDVLGGFEGAEIEAVLLAELDRAVLPSLRRRVVVALGRSRRATGLGALCATLDGAANDYRLRDAAAIAVGGQGEPGLDALLERLKKLPVKKLVRPDYWRRSSLLRGIAAHGGTRAIAVLVELSGDGDAQARRQALEFLDAVAADDVVTAARRAAASDRDAELAAEAVRQLAMHGAEGAEKLALAMHKKTVRAGSGFARADVLEALGCVLGPATYEPFLEQAAAVDPEIDHVLRRVQQRLRDQTGFGAWLREHGLRGKDAARRAVAIRLLAQVEGDEVTEALLPLVKDKDAVVAAAAVRSVGARGDRAAEPVLRALLDRGDEARAAEAMLGLDLLLGDEPAWRSDLLEFARKSGLRRAVALDLLAEAGAEEALALAYEDFGHASWQVRAAAYDFCRRVRHVDSIQLLIARISKERARLREDVLDALESITGLRFWDEERWQRWWREDGESFEVRALREPVRRSGETVVTYYDLPVTSDRCVFVLDLSGSMDLPFGATGASTRLEEARRQLTEVLSKASSDFHFNVIFFGTTVKPVHRKLRAADKKTVDKTIATIRKQKSRGRTNIHDALERAFEDEEVDTIYLLSDGYPSAGRIRDPEGLADAVQRWNRSRRIRIHAIAVGAESPLCQRLATDSGGVYRHVR